VTTQIRRRARQMILAAAVLVPASLGVLSTDVPDAVAAPKPTAIVAMGDSFTSGEAGRWAGNANSDCGDRQGTDKAAVVLSGCNAHYDRNRVYVSASIANGCHRSHTAPVLAATATVDQRINLACSGAESRHIWRASRGGVAWRGEAPQADQLAQLVNQVDVKTIFLGIGGNDLPFGGIVRQCAQDYILSSGVFDFTENRCRRNIQDDYEPKLATMQANIIKSLDEVRDTMRAAGVPDANYRIVLVGYPSLLPPANLMGPGERHREHSARCPFWNEDLDYFHNRFMPKLSANLRAAAAAVANVELLDLTNTFDGHRLCESGTARPPAGPANAEWVRFYDHSDQGEFNEQFHPNQFGQRAIGMCYTRMLQNPPPFGFPSPRRCLPGASGQPTDMVIAGYPAPPTVVDLTVRAIPDNGVREATLAVPAGSGRPAETAQVKLDIAHPRRGQLRVTLIDNKGKGHVLHSPSSATGPNVFFTRNLTRMPSDPAGTWRLRVEDLEAGLTGSLNRWSLEFY
jgi:hypothetical protein